MENSVEQMTKEKATALVKVAREEWEREVSTYCLMRGTTAVPIGHFYVLADGTVVKFAGMAPEDMLPEYLQGLELNFGGLIFDGTVQRRHDGTFEFVGKRGPRSGRLARQVKKVQYAL